MKAEKFPLTVTEGGVSAKIHKVSQFKNGKIYTRYVADYIPFGKRKQEGRAKFEDAKQIALNACRKTSNEDQSSLELRGADRMAYVRAVEGMCVREHHQTAFEAGR
jgi:hypothetical protein